MSKRPIQKKQLRRLRKSLRRPLPAYIDLIHWLKIRRHADTTGQALSLLLDGKVKLDSHVIGRERVEIPDKDGNTVVHMEPVLYIPAQYKSQIRVEA